MKPSATYYRCLWSSVVGTGVFRKRADQPNDFLIVTVALPKTEAEELADRIVALLDGSHDQEVAKAAAKKALLDAATQHSMKMLTQLNDWLRTRAQSYEGQKAKEAQP